MSATYDSFSKITRLFESKYVKLCYGIKLALIFLYFSQCVYSFVNKNPYMWLNIEFVKCASSSKCRESVIVSFLWFSKIC